MKRLLPTFVALLALATGLTFGTTPPVFAGTTGAPPSHYYITSKDGAKLYVQEFGQGSPVILLAGGPGMNPVYMKPVWQHLDGYHRVVVLNERGTGKSVMPVVDAATMSVGDYVNGLEALRRHLGLQKLVLVGHSWGGMLAMLYLSQEPEHVKKLVLLDPGGLKQNSFKRANDNVLKRLTKSDRVMLKKAQSEHNQDLGLRALLPGYFYHRNRALATVATWSGANGMFIQKDVNHFTEANYFANSDVMIQSLKKVRTVPVILIKGKEDPFGFVATTIKAVLPQTEIEPIDHCGHFPWLEGPKQVNEFYKLLGSALR